MTQISDNSRREFIRKAAYAAPAVLSLQAMPAIAQNGSPGVTNIRVRGNNGLGQLTDDPQPPGNPPINDKPSSVPGNPNNQGGGIS